jgi:hypothetical protein
MDNLNVEKLYKKMRPRKCTQDQCHSVFIKQDANHDRLSLKIQQILPDFSG